jgi:DNA-binding Lrp family transcriptional regulator
MKTIKQIADEIGMSKDRVKYQVRKLSSEHIQKKDNITYVNDSGVLRLYELLGKKTGNFMGDLPIKSGKLPTDLPTENPLYEMLRNELEVKNKLIEDMRADHSSALESLYNELAAERQHNREQIADLTAALVSAQALHAGTIQQQLTGGETPTDDIEVEKTDSAESPVEPIEETAEIVKLQKQVEELQERTCWQSAKIVELNKKRGLFGLFKRKS